MTDVVSETASTVAGETADKALDIFTEKLAELGTKIVDGAGSGVSQAWELAQITIWFDGITSLLQVFIILSIAIALHVFTSKKIYKKDALLDHYDTPTALGITFVAFSGVTIILYIIAAVNLITNKMMWISIFAPEAAIALRVLNGVL